jgi:SAM-dependent methyltransferase
MTRREIYGKYSLGSGTILADKDRVWSAFDDPEVIASYEASMRRDLAKSGIPIDTLATWRVMDVGTGRQALAFLNMGAGQVDHFDLGAENVTRLKTHIADHGLEARIETSCSDLVEADLGRDRFDFIYLNGIVQHFSDVGRGLVNCIRALKPGGLLWLYFYRSGTFDNFLLYMLRVLANGGNVVRDEGSLREHYVAARLFFPADAKDSYLTSCYMDGVFTPFARLYTPKTYLAFAQECGLEIVSSSGLDPVGRDVDHYFARAAVVVTLARTRVVGDRELAAAASHLAPESEVDQLDPARYREPEILRSIELFRGLTTALDKPYVPQSIRILTALRLFAFLAQGTRAASYDSMRRHHDLHDLLERAIGLIGGEYGSAA